MKDRIYNFAAGPSMLADDVLLSIEKNLLNYEGTGMSVMEMSHRSKAYLKVFNEAKDTLRRVMNIPEDYEILFIQGGATEQFSAIPANLLRGGKADYVVTGSFSKKAADEAKKYGEVHIAYSTKESGHNHIPALSDLDLSADAKYVHICANNTIYGTEWKQFPETSEPLICDMSSDILSRPVDVSKFGMIYAGAQKNMGISGMAVVIIRKDLINEEIDDLPVLMNYSVQAKGDSMYNTPPTFSIYVCGEVAKWVEKNGGLEAMLERNEKKAALLYDILDNSAFYKGHARKDSRSLMNVTFTTPNEELDALFVAEAKKQGMENLKGHRSVGGIRASIYNAMPYEGVKKLADFMKEFAKEHESEY